MRGRAAALGLGLAGAMALAALAEAPSRSLVPMPRPGGEIAPAAQAPAETSGLTRVTIDATPFAPGQSLRPVFRPRAVASAPATPAAPVATQPAQDTAAMAATVGAPLAAEPDRVERPRGGGFLGGIFRPRTETRTIVRGGSPLAVRRSLRPELRPNGLEGRVRAVAARLTPGRVTQPGARGSLCGIRGLEGDRLQTITGRISGCGMAEPVRLRSVDGIALTQPATINCDTARALHTWVNQAVIPTVGRTGGGVANLRVVASYACRTRNSQPGARLSEHARGNAIDIAGIGLANGSELTVLGGWRSDNVGPLLRRMHQGACGPFGTVLGPNSDRFHQDHFHFDVASYRSGPYCR